MSVPRPRKLRDIEIFRERRAFQRDDRAYRKWSASVPRFEISAVATLDASALGFPPASKNSPHDGGSLEQ